MKKYFITNDFFFQIIFLSYSRVTAVASWTGKLAKGDRITVESNRNSHANFGSSYLDIQVIGIF